jgi:hypothetical protein
VRLSLYTAFFNIPVLKNWQLAVGSKMWRLLVVLICPNLLTAKGYYDGHTLDWGDQNALQQQAYSMQWNAGLSSMYPSLPIGVGMAQNYRPVDTSALDQYGYDYVDQFGYHYNPAKASAEVYNVATNPYIESAKVNGVSVSGPLVGRSRQRKRRSAPSQLTTTVPAATWPVPSLPSSFPTYGGVYPTAYMPSYMSSYGTQPWLNDPYLSLGAYSVPATMW